MIRKKITTFHLSNTSISMDAIILHEVKKKEGFPGQRAIIIPQSVISGIKQDPLFSSLYITDIGYYPKAHNHYRERKTPISQFILIYCVEGEGWYEIEESKYFIKKNQYFIVPLNAAHRYGANNKNPWTIYWLHFQGLLSGYYCDDRYEPKDIKPHTSSRISDRIELFEEIFRTLEMGYSRENLLFACSALHHFLGTIRFIQQYRQVNINEKVEIDAVDAAIHFMRENIEKKVALADMANYIGYSISHFTTLFSKRTGYSPLAYLNQLKIQKACQLLDLSEMKINHICYKVGIEDNYYFSRLFHKIMGVSPSEYRKQKKG